LTDRELEVANCVARGLTNREAAAELFLSAKTIEFHLKRIYDKLHVRSRAGLIGRMAVGLDDGTRSVSPLVPGDHARRK